MNLPLHDIAQKKKKLIYKSAYLQLHGLLEEHVQNTSLEHHVWRSHRCRHHLIEIYIAVMEKRNKEGLNYSSICKIATMSTSFLWGLMKGVWIFASSTQVHTIAQLVLSFFACVSARHAMFTWLSHAVHTYSVHSRQAPFSVIMLGAGVPHKAS